MGLRRESLLQTRQSFFLLLELSGLFLEFVEQHRGQLLVFDGLCFAVVAVDDQLRIHLSHFLCNEAVLLTTFSSVVTTTAATERSRAGLLRTACS